ncbi:hypothetical protein Q1695_005673 [Nippostrongylus brasiliensis]|nr:hypothetical protein Q1695_005673 [Nippostrongylus brasiliensis]
MVKERLPHIPKAKKQLLLVKLRKSLLAQGNQGSLVTQTQTMAFAYLKSAVSSYFGWTGDSKGNEKGKGKTPPRKSKQEKTKSVYQQNQQKQQTQQNKSVMQFKTACEDEVKSKMPQPTQRTQMGDIEGKKQKSQLEASNFKTACEDDTKKRSKPAEPPAKKNSGAAENKGKEFNRPEQQKIVNATDPNYQTLNFLNNADAFINKEKEPPKPKTPTTPKETPQSKPTSGKDAKAGPQAKFERPEEQHIVGATDPNYETLRDLTNANTFNKEVSAPEKEKEDEKNKGGEEKAENEYEFAGALDNVPLAPGDVPAANNAGLAVIVNVVNGLIHCKKCEFDLESNQEICDTDCSGTVCFYVEFYYEQRLFTRKGCVVGSVPSTGCRMNQNGQVLCLCSTDRCNRDQTALRSTPPDLLPWQVCRRESVNGLEPPIRWLPPCAGNYCMYRKSMYNLENGTVGYSHSSGCSGSNDFDLFYTRTPFLFYPETCAKLIFGGQPDETVCYSSTVNETSAAYPTEPLVECHADFMSRNLPYIPVRKLCKGQFCVIAASPQGDVYRGCMTLDQTNTERKIVPGYYQAYTGVEQWVCATSNCNYDLLKMEESWPAEMAQFKNISRLRIGALFSELNTASTTLQSLLPVF